MTQEHLDAVFWLFAGEGHYLLDTDELLQLLELHDDAGQPIVRVIDGERCELMGAVVEPWRCDMPGLDAHAQDLWIWRLGDIERPAWLPDFEFGADSLSDH
jgi:hypothetical protein